MIQTTIVPDNTVLNITIPKNYVGKKVHAIFYIDEEITPNVEVNLAQNPSDFLGTLSYEEGEKMHLQVSSKVLKISQLVESLTGIIPDIAPKNDDYYEYLIKKHS